MNVVITTKYFSPDSLKQLFINRVAAVIDSLIFQTDQKSSSNKKWKVLEKKLNYS